MKQFEKYLPIIVFALLGLFLIDRIVKVFTNLAKVKKTKDVLQSTGLNETTIKSYLNRIIEDAKFFSEDQQVYSELLALTLNDIKAISDYWQLNYSQDWGGKSLSEFIQSENFYLTDVMEKFIEILNKI